LVSFCESFFLEDRMDGLLLIDFILDGANSPRI